MVIFGSSDAFPCGLRTQRILSEYGCRDRNPHLVSARRSTLQFLKSTEIHLSESPNDIDCRVCGRAGSSQQHVFHRGYAPTHDPLAMLLLFCRRRCGNVRQSYPARALDRSDSATVWDVGLRDSRDVVCAFSPEVFSRAGRARLHPEVVRRRDGARALGGEGAGSTEPIGLGASGRAALGLR